MPASRILRFARTRRWAIALGETRKAEPIAAASKPRAVWRMSGARTPGSIAGCAQANISDSRSSPSSWPPDAAASFSSIIRRRCSATPSALRRLRAASIHLRRATVSSQASGFAGIPRVGQSDSAAANASESASSAPAMSRWRRASSATSFP